MATAPIEPPQRLLNSLPGDPEGPVRDWLEALPTLVQQRLEGWELTLERVHAPGGRSSLVALVRQQGGTPAALKIPVPGRASALEGAALTVWDGWGAVRLLRSDEASGALLLERLQSGVSLRSLPEAKALLEAAGTVRRLWVPPGEEHPFETLTDHTEQAVTALRTADSLPRAAAPLIEEALELRRTLPAESQERFLLHGAFRQGKVLAGERAPWLAIGPAPVVGERAYDLASLVLDRFEDLAAGSGAAAATRRRVAKLADSLDVDRDRLRNWALYRAVRAGVRESAGGDRRRGELLLEFATWL
ncbi:aminoglycoside phosphotransferase family protein [Streptomyces halobius]|uniref:Aminoglycoside phosphotransferase family protein n=1 Tax=Streptomyces halobius TaxID=2879846 RepID=A0ABY4M4V2_9ACTN|nr:aminoglycoside phosphotransferase family protein [Streptomyces halobius]UQA92787.1 aminoglycoside phosphotransferase family protein [Streptomyces halobius]